MEPAGCRWYTGTVTPQGDSQQPQEGAAQRWAWDESATGSRDALVSHVRPAGAGGGTLRAEA